jgi:diaminopimelate decarboxylase
VLYTAAAVSKNLNKEIRPQAMLRITPGITAHTHDYVKTGHLDSKFAFDLTQVDSALDTIKHTGNLIDSRGIHAHIGSQIFSTKGHTESVEILLREMARIRDKHGLELTELNIGGGIGIEYTDGDNPPSFYDFADAILNSLESNLKKYDLKKPTLYVEPGRSLVGTAGVTLYEIGSFKQVPNGTTYLAVDGGMSDNIRPAMYGSGYTAELVWTDKTKPLHKFRIAGKHCESGDVLIKEVELHMTDTEHFIAIYGTGAYNDSMSSNYNMITRPAMVLVNNGHADVIKRRETYEDLIKRDIIPDRLCSKSRGS